MKAYMKTFPHDDTENPEITFLEYLDTYMDSPDSVELEDIEKTINEYLGDETQILGLWIENENEYVTEYYVVDGDYIVHEEV